MFTNCSLVFLPQTAEYPWGLRHEDQKPGFVWPSLLLHHPKLQLVLQYCWWIWWIRPPSWTSLHSSPCPYCCNFTQQHPTAPSILPGSCVVPSSLCVSELSHADSVHPAWRKVSSSHREPDTFIPQRAQFHIPPLHTAHNFKCLMQNLLKRIQY